MRILITGGAGFIGSQLAVSLGERRPSWDVIAFDNLRRRGSELSLPRLAEAGVSFRHGDVRNPDDLDGVGPVSAIIECSAEPSVMASMKESSYAVHTNLVGAFNCLKVAGKHGAQFIFLSTSRVYPLTALNGLDYEEDETRFQLSEYQPVEGASGRGISEAFPLKGARTLYGATKLGAELLIEEFASSEGIPTAVNRCGVVAGPWQLGKVDQGVFTWWLLAHYWRRDLSYIGYGGSGKQVRDLLHIEDLIELIDRQLEHPEKWTGATLNVGGGRNCSLSLRETTEICRELTGNEIPVTPVAEERAGDVPIYISDCSELFVRTDWRPRKDAKTILADTFHWISGNEALVEAVL